jgi:hypothetical protein
VPWWLSALALPDNPGKEASFRVDGKRWGTFCLFQFKE